MDKNIIMNFITNIIDTLMIFYFIEKIFKVEITDRGNSTILLSCLIAINTYINSNLGVASILGYMSILVISSIIFSFILNLKGIRTLYYVIIASLIMFIIEIITINVIVLIAQIPSSMIYELNFYRISAIIISKITMYLIIRFGVSKIKINQCFKIEEEKPIVIIALFNIIIVYMTFILYKYMDYDDQYGNLLLIGMSAGAIIFSWLIFSITKQIIYQAQQEKIIKLKEEEIRKNDFYIKNMKDTLVTIKGQRHDLNNHLNTIYGLLDTGNYDEAKVFIKSLNKNTSFINEIIDINNPTISSLLNIKNTAAIKKKIKFNLDINLLKKLNINDVDLSIILNNLIDNALEASEEVDEINRSIDFKMNMKDEYLIIIIKNSKNKSVKVDTDLIFDNYTTKEDYKNHGIGLKNVKLIVEKYDGLINVRDEGDVFVVNVALLVEE